MTRLGDAFYNGEKSVFMSSSELTGTPRSITDEIKFLSEHFEPTGAATVAIDGVAAATAAAGVTQGITNSINAINNTVQSVEHTVEAVNKTVDTLKSTVEAVNKTAESVKSVADSVNNVVTELKKVDEEVVAVENDVKTVCDTMTVTLDQMKSDTLVMNGLLTSLDNTSSTTSNTLTSIGSTWSAISSTFSGLYSYLTSHEGKITYDTEISELDRFMSEADPVPDVERWVATTGSTIKFDPQRSDVSSYNELISKANSLQSRIHDGHLEAWLERHPEQGSSYRASEPTPKQTASNVSEPQI